jgi:hypothetical protein
LFNWAKKKFLPTQVSFKAVGAAYEIHSTEMNELDMYSQSCSLIEISVNFESSF